MPDKIIIKRPRLTERATNLANSPTGPVYTFVVAAEATKPAVRQAVRTAYQVTPVKVNVINLPRQRLRARGKVGYSAGVKKVLVTLKVGEKIDFV